MKFRFIGNPRDPKDARASVTCYGITFPLNEPVEVEDEAIIKKLSGNPHFSQTRPYTRSVREPGDASAKPGE